MSYFVICLALLILGLLVRAFLLPLAHRFVLVWIWLYTLGLPAHVRARRRAEVRSDLWEQAAAERALGYRPESIALHQLFRWLLGTPGDLSWRWAQPRAVRGGGSADREAEMVALLRRHVSRLSARQQRAISLKFDAELTNAQIAQVMGESEANVLGLLVVTLRQLRNSLAHDG